MPRFFPFTAGTPEDYKENLQSASSKLYTYSLVAKMVPLAGTGLAGVLAGIQMIIDKTYPDNASLADNVIPGVIMSLTAIVACVEGVFMYLQTTTEAALTELTRTGVKEKYLPADTQSASLITTAKMTLFGKNENEIEEQKEDALTESQKLAVDGYVKRFKD